ncbi:hypothetical protein CRUP_013970 [Coryphaenoides rupestris]|nr:hypothetical protein CRUP_013970 [Coryphaenoides rupestris]
MSPMSSVSLDCSLMYWMVTMRVGSRPGSSARAQEALWARTGVQLLLLEALTMMVYTGISSRSRSFFTVNTPRHLQGLRGLVGHRLALVTSLPEDAAVDTIVLRVNATDADSGLFAAIEYSLAGGDGKFGINPATSLLLSQGDIYILALLDRETKNRYTLTAIARDKPRGSPNNQA